MDSVLDLVRFLSEHREWVVTLDLRRRVKGRMVYRVPDRTTFYTERKVHELERREPGGDSV
jgi:hypothetical protein